MEVMSPESAIRVRVRPPEFAQRVAGELENRLKGRLDSAVTVQSAGVVVITPVASEIGAEEVLRVVADAVRGIEQTFAIDALDKGLRRVRISIG